VQAADVGIAVTRLWSVEVAERYWEMMSKKPAKELVRVRMLISCNRT
jgi:hypothetical protein